MTNRTNRSNTSKDELLMMVSHELRTPLNAIQGWSELLLRGDLSKEEVKEGLKTIHRNAHLQSRIVDDLLDSSRIIFGMLTLEKKEIDLIPILEHCLETMRAGFANKKISLHFEHALEAAPMMGDPDRLAQVILNLLKNALKFTPRGGHVEVLVKRRGTRFCLVVSDNGVGISEENIPTIFDRFQQANSSTTREFGGLGLGLAIAKHLIENHGGRIKAESAGVNQGATFTVSFPVLAKDLKSFFDLKSESSSLKEPVPTLDQLRVLVVDDDPDARFLAKIVLQTQGAQVETAEDVESAMKVMPHFRPNLLLCDLSMPREDGYSFVKRLRLGLLPGFSWIPAIAITAFNDGHHRRQAIEAGFQAFVGKPFEVKNLVNTIQAVAH